MRMPADTAPYGMLSEPQLAERMLLVSLVETYDWHVELPRAVVIPAGSEYWVDWSEFCIRDPAGRVTRIKGSGYPFCRIRQSGPVVRAATARR